MWWMNFLNKKKILKGVKAQVIKKVIKPVFTFSYVTWTTNEKQLNRQNSM